nr:MAG TPA: Putative tail protein [Caudoviricetes sp.]
MAYRILYGNQILWEPYSDASDFIMDASISMNMNAAKYLDFTIPPTHNLYDIIAERDKIIRLYADNKIIYKGYITKITLDMDGYKQVNCSSIMSYLSDTHVRDYSTITGEQPLTAPTSLDGLFQWYIDQHNEHCMDSNKRFIVGINQAGILDENNYVYRSSTQFPTTSSEIEDKILNLGGYIFERYDGDNNILDFYADAHEANTQILDFGVNITDFTQERSGEDQYTAIYATGYTPDPPENDREKETKPISLADIQNGGSPYNSDFFKLGDVLYSVSGVQRYGYREYYYSNDDITTTDYLLKAAGVVLTKLLAPTITLDVKAVDMALFMENGYEHLQLGQAVRVRSKPHNIDEYLMISGIDLDLQDPGQTSYTIGATYDTLTGQQSSYLKSLNAGINSSLDSVVALDKATKENAKGVEEAKKDASNATSKANAATDTANNANAKAEEAKADAANASSKADDNTAKITTVESTIKTISGDTATAIANAKAAQAAADAAKKAADQAQSDASTANTEIGKVQSQVGTINTEIGNIKQEATDLRDDLSGQITTVKNTMEADYTRKTELSDTTTTLRNEISKSAAGVIHTVSQDYATKKELKTTTDATNKNAADLTNAINKFNSDVDNLQGQIDGAIETWFYEVDPTDKNEPAVNWNTDTLKKAHLGDLYYNTVSGYCWRYQLQNGSYSWSRITDVDVTKALADAAAAQTTANSKKRIFVATPNPPYDVGDLWTQGSTGDIMRCQTAKTSSQSYAAADWIKASKYTDDTAVTKLSNTVEKTYSTKTEVKQLSDQVSSTVSSLETVRISAEAAQTSADNAKKAADAAQTAADTAKDNAATAQFKADEAASNLSKAEKNLETLQSQANATDEQLTAAKAEVERAKTAAATAQSTANTAKSNAATAQATADTAKANAKTAQDDVDALKNRVTSAETSIKQNSDAIALRATKTEVTSAIDGISVGGRNLLLGTAKFETPDDGYVLSLVKDSTVLFKNNYTAYGNRAWLHYAISLYHLKDKCSIKVGDTLTYSIYFMFTTNEPKDTDKKSITLRWYTANDEPTNSTVIATLNLDTDSNVWKQYSYTFVASEALLNRSTHIRFECDYYTESNYTSPRLTQWWSSPKLELGNKPTDWSPAPEDLIAESKTYTDAQIKVSADAIKSEVSSVKNTADSALSKATSVEQTASGLTTKIATAQSTADTAKANATTAQSTANTANSTANAAKTAANTLETLIRQSGDGVEVAKKVNGEYTSTKTLMGADGFHIQDSSGEDLAIYQANSVSLGKNSHNSVIDFCNGNVYVGYDEASNTGYIRSANIVFGTKGPGEQGYNSAPKIEITSSSVLVNGSTLSDFVIAQGTSGIWTYRKWASGNCEFWGGKEFIGQSGEVSIGSTDFPFTLKILKLKIAGVIYLGGAEAMTIYSGGSANVGLASTGGYVAVATHSTSSTQHGLIQYYVAGTWK